MKEKTTKMFKMYEEVIAGKRTSVDDDEEDHKECSLMRVLEGHTTVINSQKGTPCSAGSPCSTAGTSSASDSTTPPPVPTPPPPPVELDAPQIVDPLADPKLMQGIFDFSMDMDEDFGNVPAVYDALFDQFSYPTGPSAASADMNSNLLPDINMVPQHLPDPLAANLHTPTMMDGQASTSAFDPQFQGAVDLSGLGMGSAADEAAWADFMRQVGMKTA